MTEEKRIAAEHKLPCKLRLTPDSAADLCFRLRHGSSRDAKESFPNGVAFSPVSWRTYGSLYAEITVLVRGTQQKFQSGATDNSTGAMVIGPEQSLSLLLTYRPTGHSNPLLMRVDFRGAPHHPPNLDDTGRMP
jgi:hypothetical protein